jgi:hypothetical protein
MYVYICRELAVRQATANSRNEHLPAELYNKVSKKRQYFYLKG